MLHKSETSSKEVLYFLKTRVPLFRKKGSLDLKSQLVVPEGQATKHATTSVYLSRLCSALQS